MQERNLKNKINYNSEMEAILSGCDKKGVVPRVLMHACCAPCASACIERLYKKTDLTVYFYNPNISGNAEYVLRKNELIRLCENKGIKYIAEEHRPNEFFSFVNGLEKEKEGGVRCERCFYLRLKRTADVAKNNGFDFFCTTLTVSPKKNAEKINTVGYAVQKETGANYLPSDFKKQNGYVRSVEISNELGLYRQNFCGCIYSVPVQKNNCD